MNQHPVFFAVAILIAYYVFAAAIGAMPAPLPGQERGGYAFLWRFLQQLAANAHRLAEQRFGADLTGPDNTIDQIHAGIDPRIKRHHHRIVRVAECLMTLACAIAAGFGGNPLLGVFLVAVALLQTTTIAD